MEMTKTELEDTFAASPDSPLFANVALALKCAPTDVRVIEPLRAGNMNLIYKVEVNGDFYVYRHPGPGTDNIVNRESEAISQTIAGKLGIDGTHVYQHPTDGWKLSRFVPDTTPFDYHNKQHVAEAMRLLRKLHGHETDTGFALDMHEDTMKQVALLNDKWRGYYTDFDEMLALAERLNQVAAEHGAKTVICHNDFYDANFLVAKDRIHLIDWEFSGMSDYASDLGVFICCSDYDYDESLAVVREYFQREPSDEEMLHCIAYFAVISFHWLVWALYQETVGAPTPFLDTYYRFTQMFETAASQMLEAQNV